MCAAPRGLAVDARRAGASRTRWTDTVTEPRSIAARTRGRDRLLERGRERAAAQLEIEEAMVDRADVDGRAHARLLGDAAAEAGHAAHARSDITSVESSRVRRAAR